MTFTEHLRPSAWMVLKVLINSSECLFFFQGRCEEWARNWQEAGKLMQNVQLELMLLSICGTCSIKSLQNALCLVQWILKAEVASASAQT